MSKSNEKTCCKVHDLISLIPSTHVSSSVNILYYVNKTFVQGISFDDTAVLPTVPLYNRHYINHLYSFCERKGECSQS